MSFKIEEQAGRILPPVQGSTVAVNCSTTVTVVDMTTLPFSKAMPGYSGQDLTPISKFVTITAEGGDLYFVTGSNFTNLNAIANTVGYSTVNANTGKITLTNANIPQELDYIPAGTWKPVWLGPDTAGLNGQKTSGAAYGVNSPVRYVAFITATGNARARFHQSSD